MQISIRTLAIVGALITGAMFYLSNRVDGLKEDLKDMTQIAQQNEAAIKSLQEDYKSLQFLSKERNALRQENEVLSAKLRKDSKKSSVVAAKPQLVEKQINRSFDSFAQDLQESTR